MFTEDCQLRWGALICKILWLIAIVVALIFEINHNDWHAVAYLIVGAFLSILLLLAKERVCELKTDYKRIRQDYLTTNSELKKLLDKMHQEESEHHHKR